MPDTLEAAMVTTTFGFAGYQVGRDLGVVRGVTVRSRSALGQIFAGGQQFFGGKISLDPELGEQARSEAFGLMMQPAVQLGANAIMGARADANDGARGETEVLAYGTAVRVERL